MPKLFVRIVAVLLVPCLVADPIIAAALINPYSGVEVREDINPIFVQQAFAERATPFLHWMTRNPEPKIQFALLTIGLIAAHLGHAWLGHGISGLAMMPPKPRDPPDLLRQIAAIHSRVLQQLPSNPSSTVDYRVVRDGIGDAEIHVIDVHFNHYSKAAADAFLKEIAPRIIERPEDWLFIVEEPQDEERRLAAKMGNPDAPEWVLAKEVAALLAQLPQPHSPFRLF
jgi:hypothetical protein